MQRNDHSTAEGALVSAVYVYRTQVAAATATVPEGHRESVVVVDVDSLVVELRFGGAQIIVLHRRHRVEAAVEEGA